MRIYKYIINGDEMFSDTYNTKMVSEVIYDLPGKLVSRAKGDIKIEGFNRGVEAFDFNIRRGAKEADEGTDSAVERCVDIVLNHRLVETYGFGDKKSYTLYLKDYMKKLVGKLEEKAPDHIDIFKTNIKKVMKDILGWFKEIQLFTGESMDCGGMAAMMEYRDIDGTQIPIMMFFKHGLEEKKV